MAHMVQRHAFVVLPITLARAVYEYRLSSHHSDPFDRLLVAQAKLGNLTLVTNDAFIKLYSANTLW